MRVIDCVISSIELNDTETLMITARYSSSIGLITLGGDNECIVSPIGRSSPSGDWGRCRRYYDLCCTSFGHKQTLEPLRCITMNTTRSFELHPEWYVPVGRCSSQDPAFLCWYV